MVVHRRRNGHRQYYYYDCYIFIFLFTPTYLSPKSSPYPASITLTTVITIIRYNIIYVYIGIVLCSRSSLAKYYHYYYNNGSVWTSGGGGGCRGDEGAERQTRARDIHGNRKRFNTSCLNPWTMQIALWVVPSR